MLRYVTIPVLLFICKHLNLIELGKLYQTSKYFQYIVNEVLHERMLIKSRLQLTLHCHRKVAKKSKFANHNKNSCTIHYRNFHSKWLHFFRTGVIWKYICDGNRNPLIELHHGNYYAFKSLVSVELNNCKTDYFNIVQLRKLSLTTLIFNNVQTSVDFSGIVLERLNASLRRLIIKNSKCAVTALFVRSAYLKCPHLATFVTDSTFHQFQLSFLCSWIQN